MFAEVGPLVLEPKIKERVDQFLKSITQDNLVIKFQGTLQKVYDSSIFISSEGG